MKARETILRNLRDRALPIPELPAPIAGITFDDKVAAFLTSWAAVGGTGQRTTRAAMMAIVRALPVIAESKRIASCTADLPLGNVNLAAPFDAHTLADLDVTIAAADFGVAENGALWFPDRDLPERALLFIAQHVIFTVTGRSLVHNMHEAYDRLSFGARGFGVFVSGPSKTADIEQSLVIGAHGPRSATVLVLED